MKKSRNQEAGADAGAVPALYVDVERGNAAEAQYDMTKRKVSVVWCRRGVLLDVYKVHEGNSRKLISLLLAPEQARSLARHLRGEP